MQLQHIKKTFVLQHDASDCGVACLLSIIQYHGGVASLENLRRLSGTTKTGTTLLGLYQCANKVGFDTSGAEGTLDELEKQTAPVILHIETEEQLQHYVVFYGIDEHNLVVGDPAQGVVHYTQKELELLWKSKKCLLLKPNTTFIQKTEDKTAKRKWFLQLIKPDQQLLQFSVFIGVIVAVLSMSLSVFSQKLIDDILPSKETTKLVGGIGLLTLILLVRVGLSGLREYFLVFQTRTFNIRIIDSFYSALLWLPKPFFDTRKIGELVARLNDTGRIQNVIRQVAGNTIIDALVTIISFGFLFYYHWQTGLIALAITPLYFFLIYRFNKKIILAQRNIMKAYAFNESNYIATMQGITAIKNYNQQHFFKHLNQQIYGAFQNEIFSLGKINIRLSIFSGIVGVVFLITILSHTSHSVLNDTLALGVLFAIIGIVSTLLPSVTNLALLAIPINEAKIAFERMFEFAAAEQESQNGKKIKSISSISIQNGTFRFAGRKPLFENFTLNAKKGEIVGLIGDSGSGKSTLGYVLQRHYSLEKGEILINNTIPLSQINVMKWRKRIGVVEQHPVMFNGSLIDNITLGRTTREERIEKFMQRYEFDQYFKKFPGGYFTPLGEEGINISGGQRQLIAFARALFNKPQLMILDEFTANMDSDLEDFLTQLLLKIKPKTTILVISHNKSNLKALCNRIYHLN